MHTHRTVASRRAILLALLPGLIVAFLFNDSLGFSTWFAISAGVVWFALTLVVTRLLYDDAQGELAAWRAAAPDLAEGAGHDPADVAATSPGPADPSAAETSAVTSPRAPAGADPAAATAGTEPVGGMRA
jgi:hypothetical protein